MHLALKIIANFQDNKEIATIMTCQIICVIFFTYLSLDPSSQNTVFI